MAKGVIDPNVVSETLFIVIACFYERLNMLLYRMRNNPFFRKSYNETLRQRFKQNATPKLCVFFVGTNYPCVSEKYG